MIEQNIAVMVVNTPSPSLTLTLSFSHTLSLKEGGPSGGIVFLYGGIAGVMGYQLSKEIKSVQDNTNVDKK